MDPVNKSVTIKGGNRSGSMVNSTLPNMQNAAMNMISGGYKKETEAHVTRSFSVNRAFGKDITNKVLNNTGAVSIPNQGKILNDDSKARGSLHAGSQEREKLRKPSPSMHSNY